ncbi:MAG: transglycosylase domain-containing protein [Akkermansiaceae bacterium]
MSWNSPERTRRQISWRQRLRRIWDFLWRSALTLAIPIVILIGWYAWQAAQYDYDLVAEMPARTVILDREGDEIGTIHGTSRRLMNADKLPSFFKDALFAREDASFRDHGGVDFRGVARATLRNLKDLDFTQGASTLTMQLARNTYDLREKKSLNRKFLEIAITYRIESRFSKNEILTHYLNRIYFGAGCYGLEEASLTYFDQPAHLLNRHQSAMLVGIIRAPHACSPFRNLKGANKQRNEVLARMVSLKKITAEESAQIKKEPLAFRDPNDGPSTSSHAERALRRPLEAVLDHAQITEGGLTILSSLDGARQLSLEQKIANLLLPDDCQAAGIALDPRNGDILAIVGCREAKPSGFNRALDMKRGVGDKLIEPLIATAALERHHLPVSGKPVSTGRQLGEQETIRLLRRFGFEGKCGKGDDLYRGTITASPLELATAYATILQGGERPAPSFVRRVTRGERELFNRPPAFFPAFSSHAIPEILPARVEGYSLSKYDYWVATLANDCVQLLWIGHDQPKRIQVNDALKVALRTP